MQRLAEVWHSSNYMDILQLAFPTSCYRLTVDQLRRLFSSIIRSPAPNIVEITCSDLNYNTTILIFLPVWLDLVCACSCQIWGGFPTYSESTSGEGQAGIRRIVNNSYIQASSEEFCLQSLNGQRAMPTNGRSSTCNILATAPRASWRARQIVITSARASWRRLSCPSLITVDSGGDTQAVFTRGSRHELN